MLIQSPGRGRCVKAMCRRLVYYAMPAHLKTPKPFTRNFVVDLAFKTSQIIIRDKFFCIWQVLLRRKDLFERTMSSWLCHCRKSQSSIRSSTAVGTMVVLLSSAPWEGMTTFVFLKFLWNNLCSDTSVYRHLLSCALCRLQVKLVEQRSSCIDRKKGLVRFFHWNA